MAEGETTAGARDERTIAGLPRSKPPSPLGNELREGRTPSTLVTVLIAWSITLAPAGFGRGTPGLASALAVAALAAGLAGPLVGRTKPRAGRHIGISLFVALATATWLAGSIAIHGARIDPLRGIFGALAWGVFALSWSDRWSSQSEPVPHDPEAPALLARAALPGAAVLIAGAGVAAALAFLVMAWWVREPDRALLAQTMALVCAVGMVSTSATVAIARGKRRSSSGRRLTPAVVRALLLLVTVAIAGAVVTALR